MPEEQKKVSVAFFQQQVMGVLRSGKASIVRRKESVGEVSRAERVVAIFQKSDQTL